MLDATCENGVVTVEGKPVAADIIGQGTKASQGAILLDKEKARYFTSNAADIKELIEGVSGIIDQLKIILTGLDGETNAPNAQAPAIAQLDVLQGELNLQKDNLK